MDTDSIRSVVTRVSHHIDRKRWSELRSLYAEEVDVDYTSLFGGQPQRQRGDDLMEGWRSALAVISTHHLFGPVDVTVTAGGASATAECHVRAWHHAKGAPGGEEWVVGGHYAFGLTRTGESWVIATMKLETLQQTGNLKLLEQVAALA